MKIIIVEDDSVLRAELATALAAESDFEVGLTFADAEGLLGHLEQGADLPDLCLIDLGLPGMSGVDLIKVLKRKAPQVPCVAHTVFEDENTVLAALRAGAQGYLLKGMSGLKLAKSLRNLNQGGAPLTPRIAKLLMGKFQERPNCPLSHRELEVLELLAQGLSYKECAHSLTVSPHTVHDHVKKIYGKLQVHNKREAVDKARRSGWI